MYNRGIFSLLFASFLVSQYFFIAAHARYPNEVTENVAEQCAETAKDTDETPDLQSLNAKSVLVKYFVDLLNAIFGAQSEEEAENNAEPEPSTNEAIVNFAYLPVEERVKLIESGAVKLPLGGNNEASQQPENNAAPEPSTNGEVIVDFASLPVEERVKLIESGAVKFPFGWSPVNNEASAEATAQAPQMSTFDPTSLSVQERARLMELGQWGNGFGAAPEQQQTQETSNDLPSGSISVKDLASLIESGILRIPGLSIATNPMQNGVPAVPPNTPAAPNTPVEPVEPVEEPNQVSATLPQFKSANPSQVSVKRMVEKFESGQMVPATAPSTPVQVPGQVSDTLPQFKSYNSPRVGVRKMVDMIQSGQGNAPELRR